MIEEGVKCCERFGVELFYKDSVYCAESLEKRVIGKKIKNVFISPTITPKFEIFEDTQALQVTIQFENIVNDQNDEMYIIAYNKHNGY